MAENAASARELTAQCTDGRHMDGVLINYRGRETVCN